LYSQAIRFVCCLALLSKKKPGVNLLPAVELRMTAAVERKRPLTDEQCKNSLKPSTSCLSAFLLKSFLPVRYCQLFSCFATRRQRPDPLFVFTQKFSVTRWACLASVQTVHKPIISQFKLTAETLHIGQMG
jgi:hypothetical protein